MLYPVGHSVALYNTETKVQRFVHASAESLAITAVAVTPNHKYLAVGEQADKCTVVLYDLASLKRRKVLISSVGVGKVSRVTSQRNLALHATQHLPLLDAQVQEVLTMSSSELMVSYAAGCRQHGLQRRWPPAGGARGGTRLHAHRVGVGEGQECRLPANSPCGHCPTCLPGKHPSSPHMAHPARS